MPARTNLRARSLLRSPIHSFEAVIRELTCGELQLLLEILERQDNRGSANKIKLVRKEIDGRRFVYLQPSVVMP